MTPRRAVYIVGEVAKALDYAHRRSLIHRDVKPANFMLGSDDERVLLADFGIARALDDSVELTATGTMMGTVAFAAPEISSAGPVDGRADVYALGCSLYRMLSGRTPFASTVGGMAAVMPAHLSAPPPRVSDHAAAPQAMDAVITKAMAKDTDQLARDVRAPSAPAALRWYDAGGAPNNGGLMSGPDEPDVTRVWTSPPAGDQMNRPPDEPAGPQSVQPEEPTAVVPGPVVVPGPEEPTVVVRGPDKTVVVPAPEQPTFVPGHQQPQQVPPASYPSAPQPAGPAYPPNYQAGAPGPLGAQQAGGAPGYGQPPFGPPQGGYAQPGTYGQPGQYGQFGSGGAAGKSPRRSAALLGGALALATALGAVMLVLGFWKPGFFVTNKLDINKVQAGVQQVLTDQIHGYGARSVTDVKCNNGQNPTVKKGDTFTCDANIDGTKRQVPITIQDDHGNYEVGRPS